MNPKINNKYNSRIFRLIPYIVMTMIAILLAVRAKYGFIWSDEPFYFSTANRFLQGDKPIIDEWYTAQIYSILLVPFLQIWKMIRGSGFEGILLVFRHLYVLFQLIIACISYRILRRKGYRTALLASILFLVSCRGNIVTLSYYSVSLGCLYLSFLMLLSMIPDKSERNALNINRICEITKSLVIGLLWGIAIVCNPYLLVLLFTVFLVIIRQKANDRMNFYGNIKLIFAGTFVVGLLVLAFVFRNFELESFKQNLEYVMSDDSYYGNGIVKYLGVFLYIANHFKYTIVFWFVSLLYIFYNSVYKKKNDEKTKNLLLGINFAILFINILYPIRTIYTVGAGAVAISLFGIIVFLLTPVKNRTVFNLFYVTGITAAVLMCASSDTHFSATTNGCVISGIGSILLIEEYYRQKNNTHCYLAYGLIVLALIIALVDRVNLVYRDDGLNRLDTVITQGCAKGLVTTKEKAECYVVVDRTIKEISKKNLNLYIMGFCPWGYLSSNMKCAAYTTWRILPDMQDGLGMAYWETHPSKLPDVVLKLAPEYSEFDLLEKRNITKTQKAEYNAIWNNTKVMRELKNEDYIKIPVECGSIYVRDGNIVEDFFVVDK